MLFFSNPSIRAGRSDRVQDMSLSNGARISLIAFVDSVPSRKRKPFIL